MSDNLSSNKRIAKNTLFLYWRTILIMIVSLFTSRVTLQALGVDNYGIANVVSGFVSMFSLISSALSISIMRFITYELGHGDIEKLKRIFSTAINIQLSIGLGIVILIETVGLWFLNNKMNIPADRMYAANWVLHSSALTFVISLLNVPYNALIVAHEKMSAFAYISILEVVLKLIVVYLLYVAPFDKLIVYTLLQTLVIILIRAIYGVYCTRHFPEAKYQRVRDKALIKEMFGFAGWSFFTSAAYLFNTHGVNLAINMFFGVAVNAARGVATQVQQALMGFVDNFTMAMNPQITKLYASGQKEEMEKLVIRGAKFSFFLSLIICLPVLVETDYILHLWLVEVPPHTIAFIRLTIVCTMIDKLGVTGYTACMATGNIKRYVLWITSVGCLVFPVTLLMYYMGAPVESTYVVFACVYIGVDTVRLWIMKGLLGFPVWKFVKDVVFTILLVTTVAAIIPILFVLIVPQSFVRLVFSVAISLIMASLAVYVLGLTTGERRTIKGKVIDMIDKKIKKR